MTIAIGDQYEGWMVQNLVERTVLSEVWKVRHFLTGNQAALKVIAEGLVQDQYFLDKFASEVKILQTLAHPNLLAGLGCFPVGHRYGVVTPWVEGWTLEKLISSNPGGLPVEDALPIAITVLETLAAVHARNIFHRDIKPNNILVEASTLKPFLIDFGIALVVGEPRKTKYGMVLGNPRYMSPEQIQRFHEVDHRSDIYSFGCVLFEMLTGSPPYVSNAASDTEQLIQVQRMQIYDPAPLLRDLRSDLPVQLEQVIAMALAKDPDERYSSCSEFAEFLKAMVDDIPTPVTIAKEDERPVKKAEPAPQPRPRQIPAATSEPSRLNPIFQQLASLGIALGVAPMLVDLVENQSTLARAWAGNWTSVVAGGVFTAIGYLLLVYRCWSALPDAGSAVTGRKAVLAHLLFPYTFVAIHRYFHGFIPAYNRYVTRRELNLAEYPENLGTAWWALLAGFIATYFLPFEPNEKAIAIFAMLLCWVLINGVLIWRMCAAANSLVDLHEGGGLAGHAAVDSAEAED